MVLLGVFVQIMWVNFEWWVFLLFEGVILVSLVKGIELGILMWMSQVIILVIGVELLQVVVIFGFNLVSEIVECQFVVIVVVCSDFGCVVVLQCVLNSGYFCFYINVDVVGIEIGGVCKNIIVFVCGMVVGIGLGENIVVVIIIWGLVEIIWFGMVFGVNGVMLVGLVGVGDLVVICILLCLCN